jgi:mono/diheme cytochrome c family protein
MLCTIIVRRRGFQRLCEKLRAGEARMRLLEALSNRVRASGSRPLSKAALAAFFSLGVLAALCACDVERRRSDAELGLNSQQAAGRRIYDNNCDRCHEAYSTKGKKGPGLKGVFQQKYLPLSGLPANDDRVSDIIRLGRKEMPGYIQKLSQQEIENLLAYMHTL